MLCNHFNIPVKCATSACSVFITSILLPLSLSPPLSLCCKTADLVSLAPWHAAYEQCNKMSAKTTSETFLRVDMRCGKAAERHRVTGKLWRGGWRGVDKEMKCSKRENSKSHVCGKTNCLKCIYGLPLSLAVSQSVGESVCQSLIHSVIYIAHTPCWQHIFIAVNYELGLSFQMLVAFYMCKNYLANTLQGQWL